MVKPNVARAKHQKPQLFVFSPSKDDRIYRMQMEQLDSIQLALQDCRLTIAEIFEKGIGHFGSTDLPEDTCNRFREKFHVQPGQFKVFLVGDDSIIHLTADNCISWQELMMRVNRVSQFTIPAHL